MKDAKKPNKTVAEWENQAQASMRQQAYKEAIAAYKELLKRETRPEWRDGLAEAYLQRALAVAAKGMYPEACVLWESHAELRAPRHLEDYAGWLVHTGNHAKLGALCQRHPRLLEEGPQGKRLAETVGVLLLDNDKLAQQLPPDSTVLKYAAIVRQALQAYCAKNDEQLEALLQQIPIRSPYRDFRLLLKALLLMETDRAAALEGLGKIPAQSPYRALADVAVHHGRTDVQSLDDIAALPAALRTFFQRFSGWDKDKTRLELLRDAHKLSREENPKLAFDTVFAHRQALGKERSRQLCYALLPYYPNGIKLYEKQFGALSPFDKERLQALRCELDRSGRYDMYDAEHHWQNCISILHDQQKYITDAALQAALIFRRLASKVEGNRGPRAIGYLQNSLALDRDDKPSYLQLLELLRKHKSAKAKQDYQTWLDRALEQYPKDVDILILVMQAAEKKKAFKKASGIAKDLLKIDAINLQAKRTLLRCHLAHARKLISGGKYELAEKELAQSVEAENGLVPILRGLSLYKQGEKSQAGTLLQKGYELAGASLCARFCLAAEALCLKLPLTGIMGALPKPGKADLPDKKEIAELPRWFSQYRDDNAKAAADALKAVDKLLRDGIKQQKYTVEELDDLCERWRQAEQYKLLEYCAKEGIKQHQDAPLFVYYQAYAQCGGNVRQLGFSAGMRLEMALFDARSSNDKRAASLIGGFMEGGYHYGDEEDYDDDDDGGDAAVAALLGMDQSAMEEFSRKVANFNDLPTEQKHLALFGGDMETIEELVAQGADLNQIVQDSVAKTFGIDNISQIFEKLGFPALPGNTDGKPSKKR